MRFENPEDDQVVPLPGEDTNIISSKMNQSVQQGFDDMPPAPNEVPF